MSLEVGAIGAEVLAQVAVVVGAAIADGVLLSDILPPLVQIGIIAKSSVSSVNAAPQLRMHLDPPLVLSLKQRVRGQKRRNQPYVRLTQVMRPSLH